VTAPPPRSGIPLLVFAMTVFATSFPLSVIALRDFGPATVTFVRMLAAATVLAFAARGRLAALRGSVTRVLVLGGFGLGVQSWLLSYAMTRVGGTLPALVLGLEPIVIGLVGSLVVREHVGARLGGAFALGIAGEAVIAGFVSSGSTERPLLPLVALVTVVALFSTYSVSLRRLAGLPSAAVVCVASLGAAASVVPMMVVEIVRGNAVQGVGAGPVSALLFASVVSTGLGGLAWALALSRLRAAIAALGLYVVPLGGALASHIGLDEPLYARHAVGGLIVVAAILLGGSRRRAVLPAPPLPAASHPGSRTR
jgi:probable blue pigment (indigoidine) exporter